MHKAIFDFSKSHIAGRCFPDYLVVEFMIVPSPIILEG